MPEMATTLAQRGYLVPWQLAVRWVFGGAEKSEVASINYRVAPVGLIVFRKSMGKTTWNGDGRSQLATGFVAQLHFLHILYTVLSEITVYCSNLKIHPPYFFCQGVSCHIRDDTLKPWTASSHCRNPGQITQEKSFRSRDRTATYPNLGGDGPGGCKGSCALYAKNGEGVSFGWLLYTQLCQNVLCTSLYWRIGG